MLPLVGFACLRHLSRLAVQSPRRLPGPGCPPLLLLREENDASSERPLIPAALTAYLGKTHRRRRHGASPTSTSSPTPSPCSALAVVRR